MLDEILLIVETRVTMTEPTEPMTRPETIPTPGDLARKIDIAKRATFGASLPQSDPKPAASEIIPHTTDTVRNAVTDALDAKRSFQIRSLLATLYGSPSVQRVLFEPVGEVIDQVLEEGVVVRVGHGFYVTPELLEKLPRLKKIEQRILDFFSTRENRHTYAGLYSEMVRPRESHGPISEKDLAISLYRLQQDGRVEEYELTGRDGNTRRYYRVIEEPTSDQAGEGAGQSEAEQAETGPAEASLGYTVRYGGGPPEITGLDDRRVELKDVRSGSQKSGDGIAGSSLNGKTSRKGGATNTHIRIRSRKNN